MRCKKMENGKETLYSRIDDQDTINQMEFNSENWRIKNKKYSKGYYILEQRDASNRPIDCLKVVKERYAKITLGKIHVQRPEHWKYYAPRKEAEK